MLNSQSSDIDRSCRLVVYAIDASDIGNVMIEKVGRLPLERSKYTKWYNENIYRQLTLL